ncbi:MAG: hypothetical protein ACYDBZ_18960 [Steroidobacteraceae bacterium]
MQRRGQHPFGVLLLTLSCLSPVYSIYGFGSDVLLHAGTGAAGLFILAKTIATYVSELAPTVSPTLVTFGALGAALAVALLAVRASAFVTGVFLGVEMLAVLALVVAGVQAAGLPEWNHVRPRRRVQKQP